MATLWADSNFLSKENWGFSEWQQLKHNVVCFSVDAFYVLFNAILVFIVLYAFTKIYKDGQTGTTNYWIP